MSKIFRSQEYDNKFVPLYIAKISIWYQWQLIGFADRIPFIKLAEVIS